MTILIILHTGDITYNDNAYIIYNDITYNINKCNITCMFLSTVLSKVIYK